MERINETIRKLANNKDFTKRYEQLKEQILQEPNVRRFIHDHRDELTSPGIDKSLSKLHEYTLQSKQCERCESLETCQNMLKGYSPRLVVRNHLIDIHYEKCERKLQHDEKMNVQKLINSIYVPKEILSASLANIDVDKGRFRAIQLAKEFVENYTPESGKRGIYFYGPFGTGKTYLLGAIANGLAQKNITSYIVYVPEFMREIKNAIGEDNLNEKIDAIKKAPILMLDDLGAEAMSSWTRDEVLGTILQFRMLERLPTFFTSNFNFADLEHHLTYSQRGEEEKIKAARIMERIKYLATEVSVEGPNRRHGH